MNTRLRPARPLALLVFLILVAIPRQGVAQFYPRGPIVQDLQMGIEWMRCSVGQTWNDQTERCDGEVARINHEEADQAAALATDAFGSGWRLPTRDELESILCAQCPPPMIRTDLFPDTSAEPYWTSDRNFLAPRNVWSISFMTGDSYGRFFPQQALAVRLVRARR